MLVSLQDEDRFKNETMVKCSFRNSDPVDAFGATSFQHRYFKVYVRFFVFNC